MNETFQVTDDQIISQLAEVVATTEDGEHVVQMDYSIFILSSEGSRTVQQASAWVQEGEWSDQTYSTCAQPDCLLHITGSEEKALAAKDEELTQMVHSTSTTLADLFRAAKKKGLLAPRQEY
jgi:hypothetical protein